MCRFAAISISPKTMPVCWRIRFCTTVQKFGIGKNYFVLEKKVSCILAAFIWSEIQCKKKVKYYYDLKFLWCKAEFSASLLRSSVSQDPSEIILIYSFAAQETFNIINVEKCFF